jgi:PKD domain
MKRIKNFLFLLLCAVLIVSINLSVTVATDSSSLQTNIALNPSRTGYPSPLESDQGWGGGSDQWEIVDGLRDYPGEWWHGLAFTGGNYGVPGVRQATIAFGSDHTFNKVIIWHHTYIHIPAQVNLQYWDGSAWKSINFQRDLNLNYQPNAGYADTLTFEPVTGSKVRYSFDNSQNNINGTRIEHGWIYEFEVYEYINTNAPPVANAGESYQANEGTPITFDASLSNDPDGDALQYRWDFESDGTWDTQFSNDPIATHTWDDDWNGKATLEVSDGKFTASDNATVTVNNVNPILDQIASPVAPVLVNTPIETSCAFTDAGTKDIHTGIWDWGDSGSSPGSVSESNGAGTVTGEHAYTDAGIYRASLAVTDNTGGSASATAENYIVVYDPNGGFVTGGGWINSPAGAYVANTNLEGKATFGFVSKYQKGATVPTGNTEFQFKVANLSFKSASYDWLVVAGSQAKYKGTGTINGAGNYGFMLSAVDGAVDKFRIKIWDKENKDTIIYDNGVGIAEDAEPSTTIGGGSIVVHKEK